MCKISIGFWIILCISPSFLYDTMASISFLTPATDLIHSNIIVYTLNSNDIVQTLNSTQIANLTLYRNAGFSWEPGGFAALICLGIFINLIRNNFNVRKNKNIWILVAALSTTFSTTGYGIFMLLILFYLHNINIKYKVFLFPFFIGISIYLLTLPFMLDKLVYYSENNIDEEIQSSIRYDVNKTPQRVNSLIIDFQDFKNNPILGYGGHLDERWTSKLGANISTISGIGKIFAVFGLVGVIFFFSELYRSSKFLSLNYKFKGWVFPFLMILMIALSYSLIFNPVFMSFWLFAFFMPKRK